MKQDLVLADKMTSWSLCQRILHKRNLFYLSNTFVVIIFLKISRFCSLGKICSLPPLLLSIGVAPALRTSISVVTFLITMKANHPLVGDSIGALHHDKQDCPVKLLLILSPLLILVPFSWVGRFPSRFIVGKQGLFICHYGGILIIS